MRGWERGQAWALVEGSGSRGRAQQRPRRLRLTREEPPVEKHQGSSSARRRSLGCGQKRTVSGSSATRRPLRPLAPGAAGRAPAHPRTTNHAPPSCASLPLGVAELQCVHGYSETLSLTVPGAPRLLHAQIGPATARQRRRVPTPRLRPTKQRPARKDTDAPPLPRLGPLDISLTSPRRSARLERTYGNTVAELGTDP